VTTVIFSNKVRSTFTAMSSRTLLSDHVQMGETTFSVDMDSGAMIYILSFIMIGSAIQMLMGGYTDTQRGRQHGDRTSLLLIFQNNENRPIKRRLNIRTFIYSHCFCICSCIYCVSYVYSGKYPFTRL
jgi:hypothetical protein